MPDDYSTFDAAEFIAVRPSNSFQDKIEFTDIHIPGGDVNIRDYSGRLVTTLPVTMFFDDEDQYFAMQTLLGTLGMLVITDIVLATAYLDSLTRSRRWPDGQSLCSAQFSLA